MSKTITSGQPFQNPQAVAVANGSLVLTLSQAAEVTSGGGQVAPKVVAITLDANGKIPGATTILANDELTPSGTTYTAELLDSGGNIIANFGQWSITGASPIDVSLIIPTTTGASYPAPVLLNPAGNQEITAGNLTIDQTLLVKNGTAFALTFGGTPTAARTATFPDNTGTLAELNLAQTFTAAQTFNTSISVGTTVTSYNGVSTVGNGIPPIVAKADATVQAANIGTTTLYAVPANGAGMYRFSAYLVVTQAATSSSTLPNGQAFWTDNDSNTAASSNVTATSTTNTVGSTNSSEAVAAGGNTSSIVINVKASTNIQYATANYASSGVTVMQYAVHVKLEYLGN